MTSNIDQLEDFLARTEKPAFRIARMAVQNDADALDIVQDSMMKLVEYYPKKSIDQLTPLFYRILQNRIRDYHRVSKYRWQFWKSANDPDLSVEEPEDLTAEPSQYLSTGELGKELLDAIKNLPFKQQQCFLLRGWQGLSEKETAAAMSLTTGTVKTHYARATTKLKQVMEECQ